MMITTTNFVESFPKIPGKKPEILNEAYSDAVTAKEMGLDNDPVIAETIKLFVKKANDFAAKQEPKTTSQKTKTEAKKSTKTAQKKATTSAKSQTKKAKTAPKTGAKKTAPKSAAAKKTTGKKKTKSKTTRKVKYDFKDRRTAIPEEVKLFKRYLRMDGNTVSERQVILLYKAIEKAAVQRTITKESKWKKEIEAMSKDLAETYNDNEGKFKFVVPEPLKKKIVPAVEQIDELHSVKLIKSFLNFLTNQTIKRAQNLKARIDKEIKNGKVPENDRYMSKLRSISRKLATFINTKKEVALPDTEINGLAGIAGMEVKKK